MRFNRRNSPKNKKALQSNGKLFIGLTTKPAMGYKAIA